jgi:hypothetical protein
MMKVNFKAISIDDLLETGNRNTGTRGRHHDHIAIRAALR